MHFRLYVDTENDAFDPNPDLELARILRKVADDLEFSIDVGMEPIGFPFQTIFDVNGNDVGRFALKDASLFA